MLSRVLARLREWVWFVHAPVVLMVEASPAECLQTLATAARPSTQRLHLRDVFANGRRYHVQSDGKKFRLTTTSKVSWHYRRRTSSSAVLWGDVTAIDDTVTRVHMRAHITIGYLLDVFLIPVGTGFIVAFTPWHPAVIVLVLGAVLALSWIGHRYNAILEAAEMVYFVQKALEDLTPARMMSLSPDVPGIVYNQHGFEQAWEKFYQEHTSSDEGASRE